MVVHSRGCNGSPMLTPQLFSAAYTDDIRFALQELRVLVGVDCKIVMVGYSLGASILINLLGES